MISSARARIGGVGAGLRTNSRPAGEARPVTTAASRGARLADGPRSVDLARAVGLKPGAARRRRRRPAIFEALQFNRNQPARQGGADWHSMMDKIV